MDKAYERKFTNLSILMPCCGLRTTLNDLQYHYPAGFTRFCIEVVNPSKDLTQEELNILETTLNTKLRKIWSHY